MAYKNIVCAVDFSEASYGALQAAGDLAGEFSASLTVVHVITQVPAMYGMDGPAPTFDIAGYERDLGAGAKNHLETEVPKHIATGLSPQLLIRYGEPALQIVETAEDEGADLIVIATHGMSGWRHYVFGSVAQRVVKHTDKHVLLVQNRGQPSQPPSHPPIL